MGCGGCRVLASSGGDRRIMGAPRPHHREGKYWAPGVSRRAVWTSHRGRARAAETPARPRGFGVAPLKTRSHAEGEREAPSRQTSQVRARRARSALAQEHVVGGVGRAALGAGLVAGALEFAARRVDPLHRGDAGMRMPVPRRGGHRRASARDIVGDRAGALPTALPTTALPSHVLPGRPGIVPADGLAIEQQRRDRLAERPGQLAVGAGLAFVDLRAFGVER